MDTCRYESVAKRVFIFIFYCRISTTIIGSWESELTGTIRSVLANKNTVERLPGAHRRVDRSSRKTTAKNSTRTEYLGFWADYRRERKRNGYILQLKRTAKLTVRIVRRKLCRDFRCSEFDIAHAPA